MKTVGILILAICPIIFGISHSISLKLNQNQIEKIIQLINWFINEIKFCQNSTQTIIENCYQQNRFKNLNFLKETKQNLKKMPFPIAWETAIDNWQCSLNSDDINILKSLSQTLGAFDANCQISALNHVKNRFEESFQNAKNMCNQKCKLSKSLGILLSMAIYIVLV